MKLHRNLLQAVHKGLTDVLLNQKQADLTVEHLLHQQRSWGARDRNFVADNIYHMVRYKRYYEHAAGVTANNSVALWKMLGAKLSLDEYNLAGYTEFEGIDAKTVLANVKEGQRIRKIRESVPDWLDELGREQLGINWDEEIQALNQKARFSLRINTIKTNKEVIKRLLINDGIEFTEPASAPEALVLAARKNFRNHPAYKNGLFEIQDVSSQQVAPMLQAQPGMLVIDGCCGAGGKTLHIAALMENSGEILAVDINPLKIEQLKQRAARADCTIIRCMTADQLTVGAQSKLQSSVDRILLDVPCSGLGVLRRKPDAKWSLSRKFIDDLLATQANILDDYAPMLKPGGILVYSTCSILPMENEQQIEKFLLRQNNAFELIQETKLSPSQTGHDGFYVAQLRKKPYSQS